MKGNGNKMCSVVCCSSKNHIFLMFDGQNKVRRSYTQQYCVSTKNVYFYFCVARYIIPCFHYLCVYVCRVCSNSRIFQQTGNYCSDLNRAKCTHTHNKKHSLEHILSVAQHDNIQPFHGHLNTNKVHTLEAAAPDRPEKQHLNTHTHTNIKTEQLMNADCASIPFIFFIFCYYYFLSRSIRMRFSLSLYKKRK